MKFSNTTRSFFAEELIDFYKDLPSDLVDISDEDYTKFLNNEIGPIVELDENGKLRTISETIFLPKDLIVRKSKENRDKAINADLSYSGVYFQVADDCKSLKATLQEANILCLEDSYSQNWRLSDNSWRQTTISEIKQIVVAFAERKQKVWKSFSEWDSSEKTEIFVYTENK